MNKLIKYSKFIALLFLISLYGCNDFQNNSFNIVFGADTYSLGKNRIIFSAIENVPCITHKAQWVSKWLNGNQNLLIRLIGFGLVEGLFFAGSFCAIYYFRKRGLLPGLALSNDWIARDEGMHFSFSALMFKTLRDKYNNETLSDFDLKDISLISGDVAQSEFE